MKKLLAILLSLSMIFASTACSVKQSADTQEQLESEIGAFEITAAQRELAAENKAGLEVLDAGRGNPNWINTQARYAYTRLMNFATKECERDMNKKNMAGHAEQKGIGKRFDAAMDSSNKTDKFLIDAVKYCTKTLKLDKDELLKELCDGIIGDYYPSPARCLKNSEVILNQYLQSTLYNGEKLAKTTQVFPTEGGTAAICYIFDSLNHNRLLEKGDKIAIAEPIFTPYLQIPDVKNYGLVSIDVNTTEEDTWDLPDDAFETLKDKDIKAFFLVNPSNPAAHQLSQDTIKKLQEVVKANPDLIIITDDVYGTFVNDFETVYAAIPNNTILVYSFSKLYGVTGWRIGMIAMNEKNVVNDLLAALPDKDKEFLHDEYSIVTDDPEGMSFIDRMVADSRSIGLYHTSGLSTPQQVFMDVLALTHLVCKGDEDPYIELANDIVAKRHKALMKALNLETKVDENDSQYYTLLSLEEIATKNFDKKFAAWFMKNVKELDFLNALAKDQAVVVMYGPGFNAPDGTIRVSLANLDKEDYVKLSKRLIKEMKKYYKQYESAGTETDK